MAFALTGLLSLALLEVSRICTGIRVAEAKLQRGNNDSLRHLSPLLGCICQNA